MPPADSAPGAGAGDKHAAVYVSLHRGEERPTLDEQVVRLLPRLADQGYQVDQARLYGDVDGPLTGPRRRQLRRFLATVRPNPLRGPLAFTTAGPGAPALSSPNSGPARVPPAQPGAATPPHADLATSHTPQPA